MTALAGQQAVRMAKDSSEKIDTTEKADDDGSEKVDTTEKAEEDGSEKVDITEKADDDGSEKVDTAEKADAADEETPDTGVQLGEPETQNDENNPAPSTSTESLVKSGSDPVAEPEKKEEDDGAQANFSSSSGSMKVDVQGDSPSTLKLSTSSDGEKKGSISGSEKRDEPKGDQASSSHSSSTKRVAFDEPADKMSEVNEEVQSENQGSQEISSKTLETRDSTTMTTIESEEPNYSEYSGFAEHLADFSVCSDSMFSKEESEDAKPQRGSSAEKFAQQAHELVNMVIENASKHLVKEQLRRQNTLDQLEVELSRGSTLVVSRPVYDNETIENIDWLTIEDFTVDRGTVKIEEFIKVRIWSFVVCHVNV